MENKKDTAIALVVVGLGITAVVGMVFFGKKLAELFGLKDDKDDKEKEKAQDAILNAAKSEIDQLKNKKMVLSFPLLTYQTAANNIQNATNKTSLDDDPKTALKEVSTYTRNRLDWLKLVEVFGSRPHYWFGVKRPNRTLPELLTQELSKKDKDLLNDKFKNWNIGVKIN